MHFSNVCIQFYPIMLIFIFHLNSKFYNKRDSCNLVDSTCSVERVCQLMGDSGALGKSDQFLDNFLKYQDEVISIPNETHFLSSLQGSSSLKTLLGLNTITHTKRNTLTFIVVSPPLLSFGCDDLLRNMQRK